MQDFSLLLELGRGLHDLLLLLGIVNENGHMTVLGNLANLRQVSILALQLLTIIQFFLAPWDAKEQPEQRLPTSTHECWHRQSPKKRSLHPESTTH